MNRIGRRPGVGASAVIESSDGHVLLTRRAKTLRSFPGIWVGPGGYVDPGETILTTVLREIHEETGLQVSKMQHEISILNLWEVSFQFKSAIQKLTHGFFRAVFLQFRSKRSLGACRNATILWFITT